MHVLRARTASGNSTTAKPTSFASALPADCVIGVSTSSFRSSSTAGVNGWISDAQRIQSGSSATGKRKPPTKERAVVIRPASDVACLTIIIPAQTKRANGTNANDASAATGSASGTVAQWRGIPNTTAAKATDVVAVRYASISGNSVMPTMPPTAPNGER